MYKLVTTFALSHWTKSDSTCTLKRGPFCDNIRLQEKADKVQNGIKKDYPRKQLGMEIIEINQTLGKEVMNEIHLFQHA